MNKNHWEEIDEGQFIRKSGRTSYEMIDIVWLDRTSEDEDISPYIILHGEINLKDYSDDDKEYYLGSYGYSLHDENMDGWIIAQCILEEDIWRDSCIIGEARSFEEACGKVIDFINTIPSKEDMFA